MIRFFQTLLFLAVMAGVITGYSQSIYNTQNGSMVITVIAGDSVLKVVTEDLLVVLNYDNAEFIMKMDKSTFVTGIDSLDRKLKFMKYDIIQYEGKFDLEYINTQGHPPLDFDVIGVLSTNDKTIVGKGHLEHIANNGMYSCALSITFNLNKNDLGIKLNGINVEDEVKIEIIQIVLNKVEDR